MSPQIILHIGTHKTGTTSIQRYLAQNRDELAALGIWYPRYSELIEGSDDNYAHLDLARSIDPAIRRRLFSQKQVEAAYEALYQAHHQYSFTIISAEPFWRIGFGGFHGEQADWTRKATMTARVRELLRDSPVRVIACLRDQPAFIESLYSEVILSTNYSDNIEEFIKQRGHLFAYKQQLDLWARYFDVEALSYQALIDTEVLPLAFVSKLTGIDREALPITGLQRWNETHPIECLAMKRYLNGVEGMVGAKRIHIYHRFKRFYRRRFHEYIEKNPMLVSAFARKKTWLSKAQSTKLQQQFRPENSALEEVYHCPIPNGFSADRPQQSKSQLKNWEQHIVLGWMLSSYRPSSDWFDIE